MDFSVYGMKLQPGGADSGTNVFEFCRGEEIIGVGWGGIEEGNYQTAEDVHDAHRRLAERRAHQGKQTEQILQDGRLNAPLRYLLKEMEVGDFVWVNEGNEFALCMVTSDWQLTQDLPEKEAKQYDNRDIKHFRQVEWVDIPYKFVPGYVRRRFSGPHGALRRMRDGVTRDAKQVIRSLHTRDDLNSQRTLDRASIAEKIERADTNRVFDILGGEETEDIVITYLQANGWRIIKSSTSNTQAKVECEMLREEDGESIAGYLQVKTGSAGLDPDSYEEYAAAGEMIFFVQSGVDVTDRERMSAITPATIHEYIVSDYNYLPTETLLKLDFALT